MHLHLLHSSSSSFKTANTLLFTLYQIAINPSLQERLRADIREVVGGERTIRPEHISKLPLLKNSITEAQRWGWGKLWLTAEVEVWGKLGLIAEVGELAEEQGHHPALLTEWGRVTVTWWTHKIRNLHVNDFVMAAKTDRVFVGR